MISPIPYKSQFQLYRNSKISSTVSTVVLKNNDSTVYVFVLNPKAYHEDVLTINYTGTYMKSYDGYALSTFTTLPVTNVSMGYPPKVTSAVIRRNDTSWNVVRLKFDRQLADVSTQKDFFTITINRQSVTIDSLRGNYDSIQFFIKPPVKYSDTIRISYTGGNVTSIYNGALANFSNYLVDNTIPTYTNSITLNSKVTVYPIPATNKLNITSATEFKTIKIFNLEGKLMLEKKYRQGIRSTSLDLNLPKGFYILRLETKDGITDTKILEE